jgi:hypothetical protein
MSRASEPPPHDSLPGAAAGQIAAPAASFPPSLVGLGLLNVLVGVAIPALHTYVSLECIRIVHGWAEKDPIEPGPYEAMFYAVIAGSLLVGLVLIVSGIGLLCRRRWGRVLGFVAAALIWLNLLPAATMPGICLNLVVTEVQAKITSGYYFRQYELPRPWPVFDLWYPALLLAWLSIPSVRRWARRAQPGDAMPSAARPAAAMSVLAIMSIVLACTPGALLTQMAALVLGIVALWRISRSQGRLTGKAFAIAGICISAIILLLIGGGIALLLYDEAQRYHGAPSDGPRF